jgi:hypothetical protein
MIMGSSAPAFAGEANTDPAAVAPVITAPGAEVEPGSVEESSAASVEAAPAAEGDAPLEEDLPIPGEVDGPELGGPKTPFAEHCGQGGWFVGVSKNTKNTMSVKYATFVKNNKSYAVDFRFSSKKSGTTTLGASVTLSSEFKVKWLGKIQAEINGSAEKSWTSELGVDTYGKVKAGKTVYGDYGIMKENVTGYKAYRHSNCETSQKTMMTVHAPYREGWILK